MRSKLTICLLLVALMLPPLGMGATRRLPPPLLSGSELLHLRPGELENYVSGIYEGHLMMAEIVKADPVICIDSMLRRGDVAMRFLEALRNQPNEVLSLPARVVAMAILMTQHPCEKNM